MNALEDTELLVRNTRGVQRIRKAVESRGFSLKSVYWEKLDGHGEGGWFITVDPGCWPNNVHPNDDLCGGTLDELIAYIDYVLKPTEACECPSTDRHPLIILKGDGEGTLHQPGCRWYLAYQLYWWASVPKRGSSRP